MFHAQVKHSADERVQVVMRKVAVIGIGQTPVGELWDMGIRDLGAQALRAAYRDSRLANYGIEKPDALYVTNMLASQLNQQSHLGALFASELGWSGIEASSVEAACASGGAGFQAGVRAVASGMQDIVAVVGVEKMTETSSEETTLGLATASDAEYEVAHGVTFVALNALMMQRYMHQYGIPHDAFAAFPINAHHNAVNNPNAMFRKAIDQSVYDNSPMIAPPINLFDSSPMSDGAAAAIIVPLDMANDMSSRFDMTPVEVIASSNATDTISLHSRTDPLGLQAVRISAERAYHQAGVAPQDIDVFEVHDAFSSMAALSLEASGFAEAGCAVYMAQDGVYALDGDTAICTMGGLKARGHPVGATGMYEIADVVTQLRGQAGANQVQGASLGMAQNIGGTGATVVTHIFAV